LPERTFSFATSRIPEGAVTTSLVLLLVFSGGIAGLRAQHVQSASTVTIVPRSPLEKELQSAIICMCGTCGRKRVGECTCDKAAEMQEQISKLVAQGKTRDEVIQFFVAEYGSQEPLSEPIDRGFNRLAWLLPYGTGAAGVLMLGAVAVRWTRRSRLAAPPPMPTVSAELESQLDDELRDLD
jgi:cytochrome c-type biogenesis protein CcmH